MGGPWRLGWHAYIHPPIQVAACLAAYLALGEVVRWRDECKGYTSDL